MAELGNGKGFYIPFGTVVSRELGIIGDEWLKRRVIGGPAPRDEPCFVAYLINKEHYSMC